MIGGTAGLNREQFSNWTELIRTLPGTGEGSLKFADLNGRIILTTEAGRQTQLDDKRLKGTVLMMR